MASRQVHASCEESPFVAHFSSNISMYKDVCRPGSVVGIATGYGLDGPGIEWWWGRDFSAPVLTGPGANPASCTVKWVPGLSRK